MKVFAISLLMCVSINCFAEQKEFGLPPTDIRPGSLHSGDLFTIRVVPGDGETTFYVVGRKTGKLKLDKLKLEATFESGGATKKVVLFRKDKGFVLPSKFEKELELELKGEGPSDSDKVRIKLNP